MCHEKQFNETSNKKRRLIGKKNDSHHMKRYLPSLTSTWELKQKCDGMFCLLDGQRDNSL